MNLNDCPTPIRKMYQLAHTNLIVGSSNQYRDRMRTNHWVVQAKKMQEYYHKNPESLMMYDAFLTQENQKKFKIKFPSTEADEPHSASFLSCYAQGAVLFKYSGIGNCGNMVSYMLFLFAQNEKMNQDGWEAFVMNCTYDSLADHAVLMLKKGSDSYLLDPWLGGVFSVPNELETYGMLLVSKILFEEKRNIEQSLDDEQQGVTLNPDDELESEKHKRYLNVMTRDFQQMSMKSFIEITPTMKDIVSSWLAEELTEEQKEEYRQEIFLTMKNMRAAPFSNEFLEPHFILASHKVNAEAHIEQALSSDFLEEYTAQETRYLDSYASTFEHQTEHAHLMEEIKTSPKKR